MLIPAPEERVTMQNRHRRRLKGPPDRVGCTSVPRPVIYRARRTGTGAPGPPVPVSESSG
jgi:hypothetical protein